MTDAKLSTLNVHKDMAKSLRRGKTLAYRQLEKMKETANRQLRRIVRGTWKKKEEELWRNAHDIAVEKFQEARHLLMMSISIPCTA
eukprot:10915237-Ditylum_brightwellii.AAC.1